MKLIGKAPGRGAGIERRIRLSAILCAVALVLSSCASAGPAAPVPGKEIPDQQFLLSTASFFTKLEAGASPVPVSVSRTDAGLAIRCAGGELFEISLGDTLRLRWKAERAKNPISYAVVAAPTFDGAMTAEENGAPLQPKASRKKLPAASDLSFAGSRFTVRLEKGSTLITVLEGSDEVLSVDLSRSRLSEGSRLLALSMGGNRGYYGFGEKAGALDKKGSQLRMWNTDSYAYRTGTDPLYVSIPFFYSPSDARTLGVFFDNPGNTFFDLEKGESGIVRIGAQTGDIDLYVMSGKDPSSVVSSYTALTGRYPLPPEWSLGFQQSRYSYFPDSRVLEIAEGLRSRNLPADVIYLDIDYMERFKCFTWNKRYFPDLKAMTDRLHEMGFHVVSMIDPGIKVEEGYHVYDSGTASGFFTERKDGVPVNGNVWPGRCVFPDFFNPAVREWWGPLYAPLLAAGIDGFWNDMNEPAVFNTPTKTMALDAVHREADGKRRYHLELHNAYGLEMARASWEGLEDQLGGKRLFLLSRAGYSGLQRYAAKWTGDNVASWEHLQLNIPMALGLAVSGVPMVGADVGGYSRYPDSELFARWMQVGALLPLYRAHSEKGGPDREPWTFGAETETVSRKALELRYRMLPLWNQLMREQWAYGLPPVRPVSFVYPKDSAAYSCPANEFMIGDSVLAVPVTASRAESVTVYFPSASSWIDLASGKRYAGGTTVEYPVTLETIPLFMRDTAILPWGQVRQFTGDGPSGVVELKLPIVVGEKDAGRVAVLELLWDDGETTAYRAGATASWRIELAGGKLTVTPLSKSGPAPKRVVITDVSGKVLATLEDGLGFAPVVIPVR